MLNEKEFVIGMIVWPVGGVYVKYPCFVLAFSVISWPAHG